MSFREKIHWVALIAIIAGFGFYFATLHIGNPASYDYYIGLLIMVIGFVIVTMTIAAIFMAIRERTSIIPKEDERDTAIHRAGTHVAYYMLVLGVWAVAMSMHMGFHIFFSLNLLLFIVVVAECIRIGRQLWLYRRG